MNKNRWSLPDEKFGWSWQNYTSGTKPTSKHERIGTYSTRVDLRDIVGRISVNLLANLNFRHQILHSKLKHNEALNETLHARGTLVSQTLILDTEAILVFTLETEMLVRI